jgi:hypothetical protein
MRAKNQLFLFLTNIGQAVRVIEKIPQKATVMEQLFCLRRKDEFLHLTDLFLTNKAPACGHSHVYVFTWPGDDKRFDLPAGNAYQVKHTGLMSLQCKYPFRQIGATLSFYDRYFIGHICKSATSDLVTNTLNDLPTHKV